MQVLDHVGGFDRLLVAADGLLPLAALDVGVPEHAQEECLRLPRHRLQRADRGKGAFRNTHRAGVLHQVGGRSLVAETLADHLQVAHLLEMRPCRCGETAAHHRMREPQVRHRHQERDARLGVGIGLLADGGLADLDDGGVVTRDEQPFHLRDPDRGALRGRVDFEEEVERTPGPLSNELEGLARGLGLARLDEVDGGPADVVAGHLAQAEARFDARLLD